MSKQFISALSIIGFLHLNAVQATPPSDLLISEYLEGSSNNKAIEIYNGTGTNIDLTAGDYRIEMYFNGKTSVGVTIHLTGQVANGQTFVLAHASSQAPLLAKANQTGTGNWFNGNDAIVLKKGEIILDVIGQVGVDPGTQWGSGYLATQDSTLVRQSNVCQGDTHPEDAFEPAQEWVGFASDTWDNLGQHTATCTEIITSCGDTATPIHTLQGEHQASLEVGKIHTIEGVVTAYWPSLAGFFVQEEDSEQDANPETSEAILVRDNPLAVTPGDVVRLTGQVTEYQDVTELTHLNQATVCSQGADLPAAITLNLPVEKWEAYEGMRVFLPQPLTVVDNYNLGRYGEVVLSFGRLQAPTNATTPGKAAIALQAENDRHRIILDDASIRQYPDPIPYPDPELMATHSLRNGDTVTGLTAILSDRNGDYRLYPTSPPIFVSENPRSPKPEPVGGLVKVASFNVLNYFNGDGLGGGFPTARGAHSESEFNRQRQKIGQALVAMQADIIGLIEIENDGYGEHSAIQDLVNALMEQGETYAFVNPGLSRLGRDAISVGLLYRPAQVVPVGAPVTKSDGAFARANRQPLVQTFKHLATQEQFTVAVNHFKSKGSDCAEDPDTGDGQGNCNQTRVQAAQQLTAWLATDPTGSGDPDILIIGDLNAYAMENPIATIKAAGYTDLIANFVGHEAYSYVFEGQAGYLDHALASSSLAPQITGTTEWHINADEPPVLDYHEENKSPAQLVKLYHADSYRASDHDPVIIGLIPPKSCQPALYSNETRQIHLPEVAIPAFADVGGQKIQRMDLYSAVLTIPFGFADFELSSWSFLKTIAAVTPCYAQFFPEEGSLKIPMLQVPTLTPYLKNEIVSGPVVECQASLQQSVVRPEVFSLIEWECR